LFLAARAGAGQSAEAETARRGAFGVEADAAFDLPFGLRVFGAFRDRLQQQAYLSTNTDPSTGALQAVTVGEQSLDAWIGVDWDLASVLGGPDTWHARVGLAPRFARLDSSAFTVSTGTFRFSGEGEWAPVPRLLLTGHVGFGYRLFGTPETLSDFGLPRSLWDGGAGVRIPFGDGPTWSLSLGWSFDSIVFDRTTRVRHLALAGLAVAL